MAAKNLTVVWALLVLFQIITQARANVIMTTECPSTWSFWESHCYYFSETYAKTTWYQAQTRCQEQGNKDGLTGSNLVSIHSAEEEHFIKDWAYYSSHFLHIGLQQTAVGINEYKWVDGTALVFINWAADEPSYNVSADLQCGYLDRVADKWHDMACVADLNSNYVCKANTGSFTTVTTTTTTTASPPQASPSGGQVFGIIIGVGLGVGLLIVGVIMWRRYDVTSTMRSWWQSHQGQGGSSNIDSRSVDNVSVASVSGATQNQPNRGSHFVNANYDIPEYK